MKKTLNIHNAGAEDLGQSTDLVRQLWQAHGSECDPSKIRGRARKLLDNSAVKFIEQNGTPIAQVALRDTDDDRFIRYFAVDSGYRGPGKGRAVFGALETTCLPGRAVRLDASIEKPGPKAFWKTTGNQIRAHAMQRDGALA